MEVAATTLKVSDSSSLSVSYETSVTMGVVTPGFVSHSRDAAETGLRIIPH